MSNIMCIQPCKFIDRVDFKNVTSYGYRCYDDYGSCYNNLWEKEDINMSSIEIFKKVYKEKKNNDFLYTVLDFLIEFQGNIYIGNDILEWKDIKNIVEKQNEQI